MSIGISLGIGRGVEFFFFVTVLCACSTWAFSCISYEDTKSQSTHWNEFIELLSGVTFNVFFTTLLMAAVELFGVLLVSVIISTMPSVAVS